VKHPTCIVVENGKPCGKPSHNKTLGQCGKHYQRMLRWGSPLITHNLVGESDEVRFWPKVEKDGPIPDYAPHLGPCWIWIGSRNEEGYGHFWFSDLKRVRGAHIWSYEYHIGPVPDGLMLDHLCRVTSCVRPDHLEPVTNGENVRRGDHHCRRRTHCVHGHEFTPENTSYEREGRKRVCKTCKREARRRRFAS